MTNSENTKNEIEALMKNLVFIFKKTKDNYPLLFDDIDTISDDFEKLRTEREYMLVNDYLKEISNDLLLHRSSEVIKREDNLVSIFNSIRTLHAEHISKKSDNALNTCIRRLKIGEVSFSDACLAIENVSKEIALSVSSKIIDASKKTKEIIKTSGNVTYSNMEKVTQSDISKAVLVAKKDLKSLTTILSNQNPKNRNAFNIKNEVLLLEAKDEGFVETMNLVSEASWLTNKIHQSRMEKDKAYLYQVALKFKEISATVEDKSEINLSQKTGMKTFDSDLNSHLVEIKKASESTDTETLKERVLNSAGNIKNKLSSFMCEQDKLITKQEAKIEEQKSHCANISKQLKSIQKELDIAIKMASFDPLTEILNRNGYEVKVFEINKLWKEKRPNIATMVVDVDHFKKVNDSYGHDVGDKVLKYLGAIFKRVQKLYPKSYCARYGGEEFVIVIQDTEKNDVVKIANRINKTVEQNPFESSDGKIIISLTVSIGVSFFHLESDTASDIFSFADKALYKAKEKRNSICVYNRKN